MVFSVLALLRIPRRQETVSISINLPIWISTSTGTRRPCWLVWCLRPLHPPAGRVRVAMQKPRTSPPGELVVPDRQIKVRTRPLEIVIGAFFSAPTDMTPDNVSRQHEHGQRRQRIHDSRYAEPCNLQVWPPLRVRHNCPSNCRAGES